MAWKYVMFEVEIPVGSTGDKESIPVLFPPELSHKTMAQCVLRAFSDDRVFAKPISAGFVQVSGGSDLISVYGFSESLQIGCRPGDIDVIQQVAARNQFYYP